MPAAAHLVPLPKHPQVPTSKPLPPKPTAASLPQWNALLADLSRAGRHADALALLPPLLAASDGLTPDGFTLPPAAKSCGALRDAAAGLQVHALAAKLGLGDDPFVGNSLVSMYGRCGRVEDADKMFDGMPTRNLVSWNALMSAVSDAGLPRRGVELFQECLALGMVPDEATLVTVLPTCTALGWLETGRTVHGLTVKFGWDGELEGVGAGARALLCRALVLVPGRSCAGRWCGCQGGAGARALVLVPGRSCAGRWCWCQGALVQGAGARALGRKEPDASKFHLFCFFHVSACPIAFAFCHVSTVVQPDAVAPLSLFLSTHNRTVRLSSSCFFRTRGIVLGNQEVRVAQEAVRRLEDGLVVRRNPESVAAAIIYMVVQCAGVKKSVRDVSMATGVAEGTIQEAHKDLTPHAELLFG